MDVKFKRGFRHLQHPLECLLVKRSHDLEDTFVLSGTSAKYSITFDLSWKCMKDILVQYYFITGFVAGSPKEVLREAFGAGMISGDIWMEMLRVRNQLAHDYDGVIVKNIVRESSGII